MTKPERLTCNDWRFRRLHLQRLHPTKANGETFQQWTVEDCYAYVLHNSWYFLGNFTSCSQLEIFASDHSVCFEHASSHGVITLTTVPVVRTTQLLTNKGRLMDNIQEELSSADPVKSRFPLLKECSKVILVLEESEQEKQETLSWAQRSIILTGYTLSRKKKKKDSLRTDGIDTKDSFQVGGESAFLF